MIQLKKNQIIKIPLLIILGLILIPVTISTDGYQFEIGVNISTLYYEGVGGNKINYQVENFSSAWAWGWNDTCIYFQTTLDDNITDYCESAIGTYQVSVTTTTTTTVTATTLDKFNLIIENVGFDWISLIWR